MSGPSTTLDSSAEVEAVGEWLRGMIRRLAFVELVAAVLALVTRLRDLNTELSKQVASFRQGRPRSECLKRLEKQLSFVWVASVTEAKDVASTEAASGEGAPEKTPPAGNEQPQPEPKKRRKKHPGRAAFPPELERVLQYNGVPRDQRECPKCGLEMASMGHTHCEHLDVIPARVVVVQRTDEAVKCALDNIIVTARPPPRIVERGVLGNRLIVEATADKFLEHQPVERQCLRYSRLGLSIAPQTLGRGVSAHLDILMPLAEAIYSKTRGPGLLGTDATGVPVLDKDTPEGIRSGTMWGWTNALWVSFYYSRSGDSDSVRRFLDGDESPKDDSNYKRIIQADGTSVLTFIERAKGERPGCWGHARRGLVNCARSGDRVALEGVRLIAPLFKIEKDSRLAGDNAESRLLRRQAESKPLVAAIKKWVGEQRLLAVPKTRYGRAVGYLYRQWRRLTLFLKNGNIALTNNRRERELRKLVLGRRNWLFVWGDVGAERTAAILSIVATCISHGINPREYLMIVTEALLRDTDPFELLPDRIGQKHPELCIPDFEAPKLPD